MLFKDRRTGKVGETRQATHKGKQYTVTRDSTGDIQVSGPEGKFEAAPHAKGNLYEDRGMRGKRPYRPGKPNQEVKNTVKAIKKGKIDQIRLPKESDN